MQQQRQIGHYIIGKKLGQGNYATVRQARHILTNARVAVKMLNKTKMRQQKMIAQVKRQILILSHLNHEKIIKFYEIIYTTSEILIFMQLAQGGQLSDYVYQNDISEQQARFFFKQIISGVAYAHSNRIAHRDLKLENILMVSNKSIKIADFGLSNLMRDGKSLQSICGSPQYYAPEIASQKMYEGTSVDIWSCGVILYVLLVKQLPFCQVSQLILNRKIEKGEYNELPENINPLARDLIQHMLQVDPYKRIRMQQILIHPWFCSYIPMYAHVPIYFKIQTDTLFQIDMKTFQKVKSIIISTKSDEELKQMIRIRDSNNFTITYEILVDQKLRTKTLQKIDDTELDYDTIEDGVFYSRKNLITSKVQIKEKAGIFGKMFSKPIAALEEIVIQTLTQMDIQHFSQSK